jgi:hypothetical protein
VVVVFDFFPVPGACACCCKDDCCWGSVDFGGPPPKAFENDVERLALPPLPPTSVREIALLSRALVFRRSLPVKGPSVVLRIVKKQNDEVWVEIVGLKTFQVYKNLTEKRKISTPFWLRNIEIILFELITSKDVNFFLRVQDIFTCPTNVYYCVQLTRARDCFTILITIILYGWVFKELSHSDDVGLVRCNTLHSLMIMLLNGHYNPRRYICHWPHELRLDNNIIYSLKI